MTPIRIPVTLSPHICGDNPRGYYLLAQRLFPNGAPILNKQQFIGFNGKSLVVTVDYPPGWNTLLKMAINAPEITWLSGAKLWPMSMGFRSYIPGSFLAPTTAEAPKIEMIGVFQQMNNLWVLELPMITGEVLLGRKELG